MLKQSAFTKGVDPKDKRTRVAKKLAVAYKNLLKGTVSVYHNPFKRGVPVELQSVFTHFLKTAEIVIEEEADPEAYIKAQFEGLRRFKGTVFPYPPQLHSFQARLRFMEYREKQENESDKTVREEDYMVDEYDLQNAKLKRLMAATGLHSEKQALQMFGRQFSKSFLRLKGARK